MTIDEKIKMYKDKKEFIESISKVFEAGNTKIAVTSIEYEVYKKDISENRAYFAEYVIVNYYGGGKSVKKVNGNSNSANFATIATMLDGGYYEELETYKNLINSGFTPVSFQSNLILNKFYTESFETLKEAEFCFNYCKDINDINKVIKAIPESFGKFAFELDPEEDIFYVSREFEDTDCYRTITTPYSFYKGE